MSYYTDYTINIDATLDAEKFTSHVRERANYYFDIDVNCNQLTLSGIKWYKWKEDMEHLSSLYPDKTFTVYGEGEEAGDIWRAFVKNGTTIVQKAKLTYDPVPEGFK